MDAETALDEVTDLIANIEMHRREIEREAGLDASCKYALGRLQAALLPGRLAHADVLAAEIRRVEALASGANRRQAPAQSPSRDAQRRRPKSRGGRPMGRHTSR